ncbi:MAG: hypothetical protein QW231_03745 [Candidatus Bathyarchaeia archaeon]
MTDVSGGYEEETLVGAGIHGPFLIWSAPLTIGEYDIVVDSDRDGIRDPGEKVDYSQVPPGVFVVPELPMGTLMAMVASFGAMAGLATKRLRLRH